MSRPPPGPKPLVPVLRVPPALIAQQVGLDSRVGFILMFMDGASSCDDIIDASGLPAADVARIVADLVERGLIELT